MVTEMSCQPSSNSAGRDANEQTGDDFDPVKCHVRSRQQPGIYTPGKNRKGETPSKTIDKPQEKLLTFDVKFHSGLFSQMVLANLQHKTRPVHLSVIIPR